MLPHPAKVILDVICYVLMGVNNNFKINYNETNGFFHCLFDNLK